jgi:MFS superfamily sulfate permease-like transporter
MKIFPIRFDRNEISGSFGDIGTALPLLMGMILASGIDAASVLIMFGIMQIFTALKYGIPLSAQPLKVFATIVIAHKLTGPVIFGGGLAVGIMMLLLTVTGLIDKLAVLMPKAVIRGIQFGLGIQLAMLAFNNYILAGAKPQTYILVAITFLTGMLFLGNRKYPPAIFIILIGLIYLTITGENHSPEIIAGFSFHLPVFNLMFNRSDTITGILLLALPQIPLSLGNSIFATRQIVNDFFPEKRITIRKISYTYSLMNIVNPFFGGIPTCHGSGGMAGHYTFGARTAGSIVIYGSLFIIAGLFFAGKFHSIINYFPLPVLGVVLFFESITLITMVKDITELKSDLFIAIIVGLTSAFVPYGFGLGMLIGLFLFYFKIPKAYHFEK